MSNPDVAWAAGFFEGEGHVKCVKRKNVKRTDRYFSIEIAQVYPEPLEYFKDIFGGKVYGPYGPYSTNKQPYYMYAAYGAVARDALDLMMPYLFRKGDQARKALDEWNEYRREKEAPSLC